MSLDPQRRQNWRQTLGMAHMTAATQRGFDLDPDQNDLNKWQDTAPTWPGVMRLVLAGNIRGLRFWRHATAYDLTYWVQEGCQGWDRSTPVVAFGSLYNRIELGIVTRHHRDGAKILLSTRDFGFKPGTERPGQIDVVVKAIPRAMALCIIPRA